MSSYFEVEVDGLDASLEEAFVALAFSLGCSGVSENLQFTQAEDTYAPLTLESDVKNIILYFEAGPSEELIMALKNMASDVSIKVKANENKDWLAEWKKGFEAFCLVPPFWIVPSWLEPPEKAGKIIRIDPGMAFGTGTHETTSLVGQLMAESDQKTPESVLDVGTGTAILAMLAHHLGAKKIVANDIDPEALRVARENIKKNDMFQAIDVTPKSLDQIDESFQWVVANIIDGILLRIKSSLIARAQSGGRIFLSGILQERKEKFLNELLKSKDLELIRDIEKGEWVGLELAKK